MTRASAPRAASRLAALVAALALAQALPADDAGAQIIPLEPALPPETEAGSARPGLDLPEPGERAELSRRTEGDGSSAAPGPALVPLVPRGREAGVAAGLVRLEREADTADLAFILPGPPRPQDAPALVLSTRSGINVLPERSSLAVLLNGAEIARLSPGSFDGFAAERVPLPPDTLRAGLNALRIEARHVHRIFCGPEPAYALWSELDLRQSGIAVSASGAPSPGPSAEPGAAAFLAGLAALAATGAPLTLAGPAPLPGWAEAALPALLEAVTRALGQPLAGIVRTESWTLARPAPDPVRITFLEAEPGGAAGPLFRRGGDGAVVLAITPATRPEDLADALSAALPDESLAGPALRPALVTPGAAVPLARMGVPGGLSGAEHVFLRDIDFRLPDDWLLLAQQKARLDLDYAFAEGLGRGALLMVKVNGTTIRLLPLDRGDGTTLDTLPIRFEARLLRPGINRLTFEAEIPAAAPDLPCPEREEPMLRVHDSTALFVPESPRMRQPDLGRLVSRLGPASVETSRAAAAQLPPGTADLVRASLALGSPEEGARGTLRLKVPADLAELRDTPMAEARPVLEDMLLGTFRPGGMPGNGAAPPAVGTEEALGWRTLLGLDRLAELPATAGATLATLLPGGRAGPDAWAEGRSAQAVLLQPDPSGAPDLAWLVLRPDSNAAQVAAALSLARDAAEGPAGQIAALDATGEWSSWMAPDRPLRLLEPLNARNLRNVLGNYATWAPAYFVFAFLLITFMSAGIAILIILLTRRPRT